MAERSAHLDTADAGRVTIYAGARPLDELLDIAAAASRTRTPLCVSGIRGRTVEDMIRIAVVGGPSVSFRSDTDQIAADREPAKPRPRRRWFFGNLASR